MAHTDVRTRILLLAACVVAAAAGLVTVAGCGSRPKPAPAPTPLPPSIQVKDLPDFPVRVMLKDQVLANYDRRKSGEYDFKHTAEIKLDVLPDSKAVKSQGLHPDGWKDGVAEIFRDANNPIVWVIFKNPEAWKTKIGLQVDNRGGEATEIFVGEMPQTIKAGGKGELFYPGPTTAEHAVVRIHGKEIGTLWPAADAAPGKQAEPGKQTDAAKQTEPDWGQAKFFVDVTGKRSYRYREVYYSSQGISVQGAEMLKLKPVQGELSPKFVHRVPFSFSFFLERAPNEIQVKADPLNLFELRTEIVER